MSIVWTLVQGWRRVERLQIKDELAGQLAAIVFGLGTGVKTRWEKETEKGNDGGSIGKSYNKFYKFLEIGDKHERSWG